MEEGLPLNYNWFSDQIAGHHPSVVKNGKREIGLLKREGSDKILKPKQDAKRGDCEDSVYRRLQSEWRNDDSGEDETIREWPEAVDEDVRRLDAMTPKFYGTETLVVDGQKHEFLILEDVTTSYRQPAILDIKMGCITYDPLSNEEKRRKESQKYLPQRTIGFRLLGYRIHTGGQVLVRDKEWGKSFDETTVASGIEEYLTTGRGKSQQVYTEVLNKLATVKDWMETQRSFHFYASSLLFLYETDPSLPPNVNVYMIDFSHVFPADGSLDDNYLQGLNNLIEFVKQLQ